MNWIAGLPLHPSNQLHSRMTCVSSGVCLTHVLDSIEAMHSAVMGAVHSVILSTLVMRASAPASASD